VINHSHEVSKKKNKLVTNVKRVDKMCTMGLVETRRPPPNGNKKKKKKEGPLDGLVTPLVGLIHANVAY
jgi:hypothetical protein